MLGSLISAGANLIGGLIGASNTEDANNANTDFQRQVMKNQVQWRVRDAQRAGVSPLVALGMSPMSASPSNVGDTSLPNALSNMGQDLSRAFTNPSSAQTRFDAQMQGLQLTRGALENELLASQIARLKQQMVPAVGGSHLIPGQGDTPTLEVENPTRTSMIVGPSGVRFPTGPGMDAQVAENRYGDLVQEVYGVGNFIADHFPSAVRILNSDIREYLPPTRAREVRGGGRYWR